MAWSKIIESDIFKVNNAFELWMNKSEIKLLFILLIWELWMVNYSPKGIHFHEICVCLCIVTRKSSFLRIFFCPRTAYPGVQKVAQQFVSIKALI